MRAAALGRGEEVGEEGELLEAGGAMRGACRGEEARRSGGLGAPAVELDGRIQSAGARSERSSGRRSLGAGRRPGGVGAPAGNHGGGLEARRTAAIARGGEAGSRRMEARGSSAGRRREGDGDRAMGVWWRRRRTKGEMGSVSCG